MQTFDGSLMVDSSDFSNIIGTSGSVLHAEDSFSAANYFINNSTFNANFAYRGFPNLFISKIYQASFSSMLNCPKLDIIDSTFNNTYGCPGSLGNNLYLCYWDQAPPAMGDSLSDYDISNNSIISDTYLNGAPSDNSTYVRVQNSVFENNIASISNSLAIIGSPVTMLDNRIFIFKTHNNQYNENKGAWQDSFALGECLTVKNWIQAPDTLHFQADSYLNHGNKLDNAYMSPLISISVDYKASKDIPDHLPSSYTIKQVTIVLKDLTFSKNDLTYNRDYFSDNENQLFSYYQSDIEMLRWGTGFLKFLTNAESNEDLKLLSRKDNIPVDVTLELTGLQMEKQLYRSRMLL